MPEVGLGLVSYGREHYRERSVAAIHRHLSDCVDVFVTAYDVAPVGVAKNQVVRELLDAGCSFVLLSEDDVLVESHQAVVGYIEACQESGWAHLSYAHHGPANSSGPTRVAGPVSYYPNSVGAWAIFTRESLEKGGLFDENFVNSWEHVEHTLRLAEYGYTSKWPECADATGSEHWLTEIPGSIGNSSIRHTPEWTENMEAGKRYWKATYPDTYADVFEGGR